MNAHGLNLPPLAGRRVKAPRPPDPLFMRDGRPAEECYTCRTGLGKCSEDCRDGLVPMKGLAAVVALIAAAINETDAQERRQQLRAAKELIEDMSVTGGEYAPEPWR